MCAVTFRVVGALSYHSEGDVLTLAATAFVATSILQAMLPVAAAACNSDDRFARPVIRALTFTLQTFVSAGIHMQSNLIGAYAASIFSAESGAIYLAMSSFLTIILIWVLGVSLGAIQA